MSRFRLSLRLIAAVCMLATIAWWFAAGAHRGWSMDKVPVEQVDEITGLNYTTYEDRYVPGVEVLGSGIAFGALLLAGTFLRKPKTRLTTS